MVTWFGNMKTMWKLILGFALMGVFMCMLGGVAAQGVLSIRESYGWSMKITPSPEQTSPLVADNLTGQGPTTFWLLEASRQRNLRRSMREMLRSQSRCKKPLEAYAATVLRISKTGRDEAKDLQKFRDAYARIH